MYEHRVPTRRVGLIAPLCLLGLLGLLAPGLAGCGDDDGAAADAAVRDGGYFLGRAATWFQSDRPPLCGP